MADTALVLGAGGVTGTAWETGILHGLAKAGVDLSTADLIVGSSAGAIVGAQLASGLVAVGDLYERQLADPENERSAAGRLGPVAVLRYARAMLSSRTPEEYGRKLGALARDSRPGVNAAGRHESIASRLPSPEWPERHLLITAVDAMTGALHTFDRTGTVALTDAVTASCAVPVVWPVVSAGGGSWIDGGVHSPANAQLASGYERVVVIAPTASGNKVIVSPRAQAAELEAAGARVEVITPDAATRKAIGRNSLDPARRAAAARAGLAQSAAHTEAVAAVWNS
ncbi:NTE family protein [Streptomyces sp. LamerLS-316]|uniref:patatin-like phospholipase family protein n=1 Tax=unclassified Streptomyces TaxID=2593676 RepID=UPI000823CC47|nr:MULTISPECIES: patatin-like phospholipase family protein [unclassified Streptomyces]MYQ41490.1 patatin-like phospholipase family protein [Streptomyces sp. SID4921]SCK10588.1 NTE family protein [Streptomyces sp. LamerLS-316]